MTVLTSRDGGLIVSNLISAVESAAKMLSDIDGEIGDGDHGVNMKKGFAMCAERLAGTPYDLAQGLSTLGMTLLGEIGGSMGPLYGTFFREMAKAAKGHESVGIEVFDEMLENAAAGVVRVGNGKRGDKTMLDCLLPAVDAFQAARNRGADFAKALAEMAEAAEKGKESTRDMIARVGRASRLGERSRGTLDAGACSCSVILRSLADSITGIISRQDA
ncbi:MAG: dihydroxyacetone kinase subunit DhaL [Spirochaetia bacterium]|jgi:dihydroxyacetone kinase-like protein